VSTRRPLVDLRVVDLSRALAGPYATMMMADAGADVVKVEPPTGDDSRGWLPYVDRNGHRESAYFMSANRNKRSVVLDLKSADGADRLRWLASQADVLVENYRPGVLERLGLGLDDLRALNPRLVTLSITGFGRGGPDGKRPGSCRPRAD
jgi:crotonobetainyl-CoA:carnitine CoA-transferase CaiB-like acyl-CoA transferase